MPNAVVAPTNAPIQAPIAAADIAPLHGSAASASTLDLRGNWFDATVEATIRERAIATFTADIDAALASAAQRAGRPLQDHESEAVAQGVIDQRVSAAAAPIAAQVQRSAATRQAAVDDTIRLYSGDVGRLRDPLSPIGRASPAARAQAGEQVLFENSQCFVLVDRFSPTAKLLVVPRQRAMFVTQLAPAALKELTRVAEAAAQAMAAAAKSPPAQVWINPPQYLSLGQLHVHVHPQTQWQANTRTGSTARGAALYQTVAADLARRLGGST